MYNLSYEDTTFALVNHCSLEKRSIRSITLEGYKLGSYSSSRWHQFLFLSSGRCAIFSEERSLTAKVGDVIFIPTNKVYSLTSDSQESSLMIIRTQAKGFEFLDDINSVLTYPSTFGDNAVNLCNQLYCEPEESVLKDIYIEAIAENVSRMIYEISIRPSLFKNKT